MAYQSLYRRYRPGGFEDHLVGQEHVVTALRNAVRDGRVGHAYLFSGPRGTGKTTMARILAKALNCTNLGEDAEPCGECDSCRAFAAGTSYDLHELDAASNNGVDAIRDLIAKVALGSPGRTKVYVLDEVHMLTSGAENALLKTLEEPPGHVVFVLCTTEPHKVVPTIRSRTQHFTFELLPADALAQHVRWIGEDAGLALDDTMVDYVVRAGKGSARDTLSALEKVVAAGGVPADDDAVDALVAAIAARDTAAAMAGVTSALRSGRDPRVIGEALLGRLREGFLAAVGAPLDELTEADLDAARRLAEVGPARLTRSLELLGTALVEMRQAPDPRIDLEVALLRLTRADLDTDLAGLLARIERLEQGAPAAPAAEPAPEPGVAPAALAPPRADVAPVVAPEPAPATPRTGPAAAARARLGTARESAPRPADSGRPAARAALGAHRSRPAAPTHPAGPDAAAPSTSAPPAAAPPVATAAEPEALWADVLARLKPLARSLFSGGRLVESGGGRVVVAFPNVHYLERCTRCREEVEAAFAALGAATAVELVVDGDAPPAVSSAPPAAVATSSEPAEETVDLDDLVDAPAGEGDGLRLITDAFPGAEVIDTET